MRVITSLLTLLLVAVAFGLFTAGPAPSTDGGASAPAVAADAGQSADAMPGCPGKANGGACCASCQAQAQAAAPAEVAVAEKPAGCPCQERARRLREAQERAKQQ